MDAVLPQAALVRAAARIQPHRSSFRAGFSSGSAYDKHRSSSSSCSARLSSGGSKSNALREWCARSSDYMPQVALGSTLLALAHPPSFTWFTSSYYTPALGYLMFAAGINLSTEHFRSVMEHPGPVALGYAAQYLLKPLLGVAFSQIAVHLMKLPESVGAGLILVSCVSGAQLSNYATFLTEPNMAPLSIVMTALSTATAVFVTPTLTLLLLGRRLPLDAWKMMLSILQVVILPIACGQLLNRCFRKAAEAASPFLPLLSVFVTSLCVGAPLASNCSVLKSALGIKLLLPVAGLHAACFFAGYVAAELVFPRAKHRKALAKTICLEAGMQSSLLGLALANKFFNDPLVGLPSAISVVVMTLMGFSLVKLWQN